MDLFIPSGPDLAGWASVVFAALACIGLGRLATWGRAAPEGALVAGWGVCALVLTLWGVATPATMRAPAIALAVLGLAALLVPRLRLARGEWLGLARIVVLALPLLAVLASARPSEPDTFLNILPNAAYIHDHGFFPGAGRPPAYSYLPAAPYNLQIAGLIAGLVSRGFPQNALIVWNLVLQLAAALLLARLVTGDEGRGEGPSWGAVATGLLLATVLNPGFVPRFDFAGYGEPGVAVTLAFAGVAAARALGARPAREPAWPAFVALALTFAALVEIKQDGITLVVAVAAGAAFLALCGAARGRALAAVTLACVPAVVLYLAWRWYVLHQMPEGELVLRGPALWEVAALPTILLNMLRAIGQKIVFYAVLAAAVAACVWHARRMGLDLAARLGLLVAVAFVLYSASLIFAYIAVLPGPMGVDAHSYFRYSTHLSLLLMAAIAAIARAHWPAAAPRAALAVLGVVAMLASPFVFLRYLRFDLEPPALRVWQLAAEAAPALHDGDRVALILPGDNGSVAAMLETVLRLTPPRRPALQVKAFDALAPGTLDRLTAEGYDRAILSCAPSGNPVAPPGTAAILVHDDLGWRTARVFQYAPPRETHWSHVLADAALCL